MANIKVLVADASHEKYVDTILDTIRTAAKKRGTGIAERTHEYVATKMKEGKAILAVDTDTQTELGDKFVGFSYIETWGNKSYVTTSGLIVHPDYLGMGVAKRIKNYTFTLARVRWPHAKIFSLTRYCEDANKSYKQNVFHSTKLFNGILYLFCMCKYQMVSLYQPPIRLFL